MPLMRDELKVLEQRWGLALQSAAFGVWDLDPQRNLVHYSPEWKAKLGYGGADVPESTSIWRERVHPDDLAPMLDALLGHIDGGQAVYDHEFRLRAADGAYRWVLSRGRVVDRDAAGRSLRMVGTLTDLTDRREAEALRIQRDRAEAASQAKTEFLSRMSHELRTPLNAVIGFAQLLSESGGRADADAQRRYAGHIQAAGWQLLKLVEDVLDLSLVQSGELQMDLQPVALPPLLRAAAAALAPQAAQRAVVLRLESLPDDAVVVADPQRLNQIVTNLLGNAIAFNRTGGTVTVQADALAGRWQLSIHDTGVGIPAAQLQHVFEPFNRLGRTGRTDAQPEVAGVGVGLALSRRLVDAMHGVLSVRSVEGRGSTFSVTLPAA